MKQFKIKKGRHYSNAFPFLFYGRFMERVVYFSQSCRYKNSKPENQEDINKLFGFTDGFAIYYDKKQGKYRWKHSARFGWNYDPQSGKIRLYAYVYSNGKQSNRLLCSMEIGRRYRLKIIAASLNYFFFVELEAGKIKAPCIAEASFTRVPKTKRVVGLKANPYFGGDEKAPHDIYVYIGQP